MPPTDFGPQVHSLCLIQPRVSPGPTVHKFRLCPRFRLCCLRFLRQPCCPFFRRCSFRLGPTVAEPPLLASLRPPWIMVSSGRILLHQPSHDQPRRRENRARLGVSRLRRFLAGLPSTQFLLCRSNTPPMRSTLLRPCLVPSGQRHLGMSVPQPLSPRCHHRQKSSSSSVSSDTRTPIGRMNNAPSQFVTPPSGMLFSEVPRSSPTISLFTWRLTNAARCR